MWVAAGWQGGGVVTRVAMRAGWGDGLIFGKVWWNWCGSNADD